MIALMQHSRYGPVIFHCSILDVLVQALITGHLFCKGKLALVGNGV